MSIEEQVHAYIVENFLLGEDECLDDSASLLESGVVDSTGVMELAMFVEDAFKIKVNDEDFVPENFGSVRNIARFVGRKEAARDAATPPPAAGECS